MKLTDKMKQCKSRTGMLIPIEIYKMDFNNLTSFTGQPLGHGFVLYHANTRQIETDLVHFDGRPFIVEDHIRAKQDYEHGMLVVFTQGIM